MQSSKLKLKNQNYFRNFKFYTVIFGFSLFAFSLAMPVFAAVLYLEPSSGEYQSGETFIVSVRIDTEDENINTVKSSLSFTQDLLEVVDFSQGDSILTLWAENPKINQSSGLISFAGGIPNGYCGRISGDPGKSNLLGKIILKIQDTIDNKQAEINFLDSSQVLLNDGKGTPAGLTTKGAIFTIFPEPFNSAQNKDEWQEELKKDEIPPEPFVIEVRRDPAVFEGRYFLIFSTVDKQTGLDRYEVSEERDKKEEIWKIIESPYLLEDQELQSIIKVKATDKAGNERIVEVGPIKLSSSPEKKLFRWWIIALIVIVGAVIWRIIKKRKNKKQKSL